MDELDIDKIVEFMNSEPNNDVDSKEIESTLNFIDTQLSEVKKESKELTTPEEIEKQETTIEDLTQKVLEQFGKIDKNTDEIYNLFYGPIATRQDRSDASKQALIESQRLKIEMINALTGLATAKAKVEAAKVKQVPGVGIYTNAQSGSDVGISLHSLWEETK